MSESQPRPITIALAGNPNSGKTSIFNALTGTHQHVGNYGGVTVEIKTGVAHLGDTTVTIVDLPGTYSLSAFSMEERVARDYIVEQSPDIVVQVIDATNLERHLILTTQLMEMGIRPLLALNMWDEVLSHGLKIDINKLSQLLHLQIVTTVGRTATGTHNLLENAVAMSRTGNTKMEQCPIAWRPELKNALDVVASHDLLKSRSHSPQWLALKLFENDTQVLESLGDVSEIRGIVADLSARILRQTGSDAESLIAESRYGFVAGVAKSTVSKPGPDRVEISDRIDSVLTQPALAYPIFLAFMWILFQATFALGQYPAALLDAVFGWLSSGVESALPSGPVRDLLSQGIINGVGSVVSFLPNIMILFFGIAIMEDTGYMARAAFIMDRFMNTIGLHGKSFVPVIIGMGCSVPAILAARTLESPRDRIKTMLLTPLISCSARLPVYVLFAGALFPRHPGAIVFLFNLVFGLAAFFGMGLLFHKTLFRGEDYPFVMELPPYRIPTMRNVAIHMWQRARHYLQKMGGVVLIATAVVWWLGHYPVDTAVARGFDERIAAMQADTSLASETRHVQITQLQNQRSSELMSRTYIGRIGQFIEPVMRPLGFDWRAAVSLVAGFVAKEIVVSSMSVLYGAGDGSSAESPTLREQVRQHFTPLSGFAFMLFVLLYTPCIVALITLVRELRDWRWSLFSVVYQVAFAWSAAFIVYQGGRLIGLQ